MQFCTFIDACFEAQYKLQALISDSKEVKPEPDLSIVKVECSIDDSAAGSSCTSPKSTSGKSTRGSSGSKMRWKIATLKPTKLQQSHSKRKKGRPKKVVSSFSGEEEATGNTGEQENEQQEGDNNVDASCKEFTIKLQKKKWTTWKRKKRPCYVCGFEAGTLKGVDKHFAVTHPGMPIYYMCPTCKKQSHTKDDFVQHYRNEHIRIQMEACETCGKFYKKRSIERHRLTHTDVRGFQCDVCGKGFKFPSELKVHTKIHLPDDQKYTHCCEICGRRFTQKGNLDSHLRTHTGEKPFGCLECGKTFTQKGNLDEHVRSHTGERPFVCDYCGLGFPRKGDLVKHRRAHTGETPYPCSYCEKSFKRREILIRHERIHTGSRPFVCEFCGKGFRDKGKLVVHNRQHTGERPYVCQLCGRGFCENGNLKKHLAVHSGTGTGPRKHRPRDEPVPQQQEPEYSQCRIEGTGAPALKRAMMEPVPMSLPPCSLSAPVQDLHMRNPDMAALSRHMSDPLAMFPPHQHFMASHDPTYLSKLAHMNPAAAAMRHNQHLDEVTDLSHPKGGVIMNNPMV